MLAPSCFTLSNTHLTPAGQGLVGGGDGGGGERAFHREYFSQCKDFGEN